MKKNLNKVISDVTIDTLEKLAFIFSSPDDDRDSMPIDSDAVIVSAVFKGPFTGTLFIVIVKQLLPELAVNMLGVDDQDELTQEQQIDAFKETINIICGNLLLEIAEKKAVFNIDAPQIMSAEKTLEKISERKPSGIAKLSVEDEPCDLILFIDD